MASYNDVFVRPTEITFSLSPHLIRPVEVLILNRSQKRLRYKILCTAKGIYALSKCRGTLVPDGFVKINIELLRSSLHEQNRRDFFKIQFFDCMDDSLQGERFISSVVLPDPVTSGYRSLDSDSCSSWPNRSIHNLSIASQPPRALSMVRPSGDLPTCASQPNISGEPKPLSSTLLNRQDRRNFLKSLTRASPLSITEKTSMTPRSVCKTASKPSLSEILISIIRRISCFLAFFLCFVGICLPMLLDELTDWSHLIATLFRTKISPNSLSVDSCLVQSSKQPGYGHLSSSCSSSQPYSSERRVNSMNEFARHSQLAIVSLKAAVQSIYEALTAVNPLNLIANLSWFSLGLLVMYTLKRR